MNDLIGKIVVIKRNGADGPQFPLRTNECLFGRKPECDIRIQLPNVSLEHAVVRVDEERKVKLVNLSSCNQTLVNGKPVSQVEVQHLDVFTISDRSFRFEFPSPVQKKTKEKSPKTHRRCSSTSGSTQQENRTPKMPTPKGSPRTPPTAGSLKENIHRLRRYSMPFQEEEEALASPAANKTPFSTISVNCEPQEQNYGSAELISEKTESVKEERKSQRRSKRVSFGPVLSPEQFDKELPPATPLRRGATPRRSTNSIDHSIIPLHSSAKKRRSVIASPHTESIIEEDCGLDALMNETPKTQVDSLTSQQLGTPTGRRQSSSQLDKMIPGDTDKENIAQTIVTPENSSKFPQMAVSVAVEGQFSSNQATPKSATPKGSRRSSSRIEQKKDQGPHESTRRSSGRLAAKSPSLLEVKSVEKQSKVTVSSGPCVEDNLEETMLDSDEYTSDEDEEQGKMAVSKGKSNRLATPLRKEIEEGVKLQKTMKKMVTPLKTEIANGIKLRQTKKRLATPLQNKIIDGTSLRQTKMKMATPLKKEIADGVKLQATKKKMATPLRKEIAEGVRLRQTKKRLATPLKKEITEGISLRQTKQKIATPLKKEITEGITLRETKKKLQTPIRKAIEDGVHLKATKKKLATPLRKAIQAKPQLRQSKKIMSSLLQNEIKQGPKLRKTKQTMPLEIQIEIIKGKQLRPTKKSLPTPLKKAISDGVTLRKTMKSLPTPVKEEIKEGVQLNKTKKSLPTPVRRQLEEGVALKQTVKSSKRKRSDVGVQGNEPKRSRLSTSKEESEAVRRALKTPLRKAIVAGTRLRATRHRMATPLRNQIHSKHVLRAVRRKSAVSKVPRKPTYAEIVKRSKKRVSQGSTKFGKAVKVFTKAIPPAKIDITAPTKSEIPTTQDKRNSIGFARKNTPQTKSTRKISSRGTSTCTETDEENQKKWMRSLARATKGVKTRFTPEEHLEGLSQMFATPPAVQINSNRSSKQKKSDNWLSSLAKATNGARKRGVPVEDFEGVSEMFATPPSRSLRSTDKDETDAASPNEQELHMTESLEPSKTPSLRSSRNNTEVFQMVTPIQSSCTPSLRSGKKAASKTPITPQVTLSKVEEVLKPKKTPSLRNSEEDAITVHVVTPVQPSRTPSLRSAKIQSRVLSSECSDPDLEFVQPLVPSKTPSMRSSAQVKAVLQKNVENPSVNRKSLGLQGLTRMLKSPKQNNAVDNVDDFFVPNLFASPKPDPKRYSRKSEGLQGVPRLLKTPKAKKEVAEDSPKLNGIKEMMQTEKTFASPNLVGLRILMKTPETHVKDVHAEDLFISELFVAPQDDLPQPSAILATQNRKDKKPSTVIDLTSPETEATTAKGAKKNDSEASPRTTRGKRKGESIEPAPKRGRRTRGTVKQEKESVPETHTKSKAAEKKSTTKSKKIKAAAVQSTPKPFVFKRTQLEPIVEVLSPLPSFDDPEATNEGRKTTSVADTQSQSKAPLRSSRRGTRAKAETSVEESSNEEVAEKNLAMKSKKNKPCDAQQDAMEEKRTTRRNKIKETQLSDVAPPVKTRATRSRKAEVEPTVEPSVTNQTTRRSRRAANTIEESVQVQGETKLITQNTDPKENQEKTAEIVPEVRSTRSSRKSERDSNNVEKDVLTRRTRGKNSKKVEVQESGKESKPKETEAADEPRSTRQTRASTKEKASLEEDTTSLQEKKQVPPDTSAKKSRPKRELKGKTAIEPRQTRSTRSVKPVENEVEPSEQSVRSTRGTKRNRQDADTVVPEPKRTRASVQTRSVNTRQTRSRSQK